MTRRSSIDWKEIHEALSGIARRRAGLDAEEARWLVAGERARVWEPLGFGGYVEYLDRVCGYRPRLAIEKLRVASALEALPAMAAALGAGDLSWSAVRELTRVANAETEPAWIEAARDKTVREIERLVSGRRPGDLPSDPADPEARRHTLHLEVSAATFAAFREARRRIEEEVGHALDDDAALGTIARLALGGADGDDGRSPYQIAVTVCESCGRGAQDGAGEAFELDGPDLEAARCDAQEIGSLGGAGQGKPAAQTIPPATRRLVLRRQHGRCAVPGCRSAKHLELHHLDLRSEGGGHDPTRIVALCWVHHRAFHHGTLVIEGRAPGALSFAHPDGTRYGGGPDPAAIERRADAFSALRQLGVREGDARRALAAVGPEADDSLESLLRAALRVLARTTYARRITTSRASEPEPTWGWRQTCDESSELL